MNKAKRTGRKRRNLLLKGLNESPKSLLGRWALRIWQAGKGWSPSNTLKGAK